MAAESLWDRSGSALDGSWSRLGALKIAPRRPDGDRGEVRGRWVEHLSLTTAPGERHYQRLPVTNNNWGSEHALGQRPGEFSFLDIRGCLEDLAWPRWQWLVYRRPVAYS